MFKLCSQLLEAEDLWIRFFFYFLWFFFYWAEQREQKNKKVRIYLQIDFLEINLLKEQKKRFEFFKSHKNKLCDVILVIPFFFFIYFHFILKFNSVSSQCIVFFFGLFPSSFLKFEICLGKIFFFLLNAIVFFLI